MKAQKGSITVMLILVLCALVMAVTLVVEVARIKIAEGQAKRAVDTALFSALAAYDQDTKDDYGLFYRYDAQGLDQEIREEVEKTLLINDGSAAWHPYEFQVQSLEVRALFPLNEKESIKHQIVEYMKYRGPEELVGEVAEKLGAFFSMQATAQVMKEDLTVDSKLKRIVMEIEALKKEIATIGSFPPEAHQVLCREAKSWSAALREIKDLEEDIEQLEETIEYLGYTETEQYQRTLEEKREERGEKQDEIRSQSEASYETLAPVVAAHERAIKSCERLKTLGPEVEAAIRNAEQKISREAGAIPEVTSNLKNKYDQYKAYANQKDLGELENRLKGNLAVTKPQLQALKQISGSGEAPADYPGVFSGSIQVCGFKPTPFPGVPEAAGTPVELDWGVIKNLMGELGRLKEGLKALTSTVDQGPIAQCPGGGKGAPTAKPVSDSSGDAYDQANDTVSGAFGQVGRASEGNSGFDSNALIEGLAGGTLSLSKDLFESLLVNEYVLDTFNNRLDKGVHGKHILSETEVEYILIGSSSPSTNAALAQGEILAWRTVFNAISFTVCCKEVSTVIDEASLALNLSTGIPYPLWKGTLTGLFSMIEACADVSRMYADDSITMIKYKVSELSIYQILQDTLNRLGVKPGAAADAGSEGGTAPKGTAKTIGKSTAGKNLTVDYEDHLRAMLLYRSMLGQGDTTLYRIQDLVYTNIKATRGEYDPSKHVNFIEADVQFTIKSFFPNLSGINAQVDGIPMGHTISVSCGRGY